ncbi:MAG: O-antigen biosynthesis protein [Desulfobacteraceae bacterium Eth-SRB2]|nr:MAG: O-antigen biosynthesis protein [Desulfobacteraceae bacterium Eth-SRB2]
MSILRRYLTRSVEILQSEGMGSLWRHIRLKTNIRRFTVINPHKYSIEEDIGPLRFAACQEPIISIIIPVFNQPLYTYSCLKSIAENSADLPFEVIVIDDCSDPETMEMLRMIENIRVIRNETNRGFIKSCNRGAGEAKGRYLVILNNDTIVTEGWLQALLKTYEFDSKTGLVGCKLIYPDGQLQEAGGIFWNDGSAWNYGKLDDQNKPEYNYLREVDYCSGACLMIPRQLFHDVGMFDEEYAPAYYEDADLAFKVREMGRKVYYQPGAVVVHFEGVTSGTSVSHGVKRYQRINHNKFYQKWKSVLAGYRDNGVYPEFEKERCVDKRILVVDARMITPDRDAGSHRMFELLDIFRELGYKVTFVPDNLAYQQPYVSNLQERGVEVLYSPYIKSVEKYLRDSGGHFDVIVLSRADVACRFINYVKEYSPDALVIFDTVDLHFLRERRMAELKNSRSLQRLAEDRKKQELDIASKADITVVVSPVEKEIIQKSSPELRIEIVPTIHEVHGSGSSFQKRDGILFVGGFEHPPNTDAAIYYVQEILPLIRQRLGGTNTYIVGNNPPSAITLLASRDVIVTGYVEDISNYFNKCRVSIAPLRYGSGVKGKVNMSMSYGLPTVVSSIAAEGMFLSDGCDALIADTPKSFANAVVRLYNDEILWNKLSANGLSNVEKYFSKDMAKETLENIFSLKQGKA